LIDLQSVLDEVEKVVLDESMLTEERLKSRLELYDCLQAFSSREELDHNNPWFCPVCRRHQTATKTLSGKIRTSRARHENF
jgi:ubiquitin C-terminal hydrolase